VYLLREEAKSSQCLTVGQASWQKQEPAVPIIIPFVFGQQIACEVGWGFPFLCPAVCYLIAYMTVNLETISFSRESTR